MAHSKNVLGQIMSDFLGDSPSPKRRRTRRLTPMVDGLEDRVVLSHLGGLHHLHAHHPASVQTTGTTGSTPPASTASTASTTATTNESTSGTTTSTSNTALSTARQTLRNDIQTIELAS